MHRTLRKENQEVYVANFISGYYTQDIRNHTSYRKDRAYPYEKEEAIKLRDCLNHDRVGKQYLWVISKVEE